MQLQFFGGKIFCGISLIRDHDLHRYRIKQFHFKNDQADRIVIGTDDLQFAEIFFYRKT